MAFSFSTLTDEIETHPMMVALGFFVLAFVGYQVFKKSNTGATVATAAGSGTTQTSKEIYNQTYQSYPTVVPPAGSSNSVPIPPVPPPAFMWPAVLTGQKIWQGTVTGNFFYGPKGPQKNGSGQSVLSGLFPSGTKFASVKAMGSPAGSSFTYTIPPGGPMTAPVALSDPNPH